jgi:tetratricopeptide (TPR) repeat protein
VYRTKNEREKAIHHFEEALKIASDLGWDDQLFWINRSMAQLFLSGGKFDDANVHIERAKSHTTQNAYNLGRAMEVQARIWHQQRQLTDSASEASRAVEIYKKQGALRDVRRCEGLLKGIQQSISGEPLKATPFPIPTEPFPRDS